MVVTITGVNDLLRTSTLDGLVNAFVAQYGTMAVERFDGEEVSTDRMRESLQSVPFLIPRKLVILREPSKQKAFVEAVETIIKDVTDITDLIIYEPKLDKRSSYFKVLKKSTDFRELNDLDGPVLSKWAVDYVREKGGELSLADTKTLIDRVGPNQQLLQSELDKLLAYSDKVTHSTIELLTEPLPQSSIFELLDAAFSGRISRAQELYREQRTLRVEPQAIMAMLSWQLYILAVVKAGGTQSVDQIAKSAKLNPFVVRKSQGALRNLTLEKIKWFISELLKLDVQLKRSSIDADEALQLYLLKLSES